MEIDNSEKVNFLVKIQYYNITILYTYKYVIWCKVKRNQINFEQFKKYIKVSMCK